MAKNGTDPVETYDRFTLKLAFLRHDGSWSAPWSYDITTQVKEVNGNKPDIGRLGLAASGFQAEDTLLVFVYKTGEDYKDFGVSNKNVAVLYIYSDGTHNPMNAEQLSRYSIIKETFDTITSDGARIVKRANYKFAQDFDIPGSLALNSASGQNSFFSIDNASIPQISHDHSSESLVITLNNREFTLNYRVNANDKLRRRQLIAMKACGKPGHNFIFADEVEIENVTSNYVDGPLCVYNTTNDTIGLTLDYLFDLPENYYSEIYLIGEIGHYFFFSIRDHETVKNFPVGSNRQNYFKECNTAICNVIINNGSESIAFSAAGTSNWIDLNTGVDTKNILFSDDVAGEVHTFTAEKNVKELPSPSFEGMNYVFNPVILNASDLTFINNIESIDVYFEIKDNDGKSIGKASSTLTIKKVDYSQNNILHLYNTDPR